MRIETLAVHAGHSADPATGAITPPIHLSTTFEREADGQYRAGLVYSRYANPNRLALEECLAQLEGGAGAAWLASRSAATAAVTPTPAARAPRLPPPRPDLRATELMPGTLRP